MTSPPVERTTVFVSYCHKDAAWLERLRVHLRPLERDHTIELWADTKIAAGSKWRDEIERAMVRARIAILIVSADYLASDFIAETELPPLLAAAEGDGLVVVPLLVSACFFERSALHAFQSPHSPREPLNDLTEAKREQVLAKFAAAIEGLLEKAAPKPEKAAAGAADETTTSAATTSIAPTSIAPAAIGPSAIEPAAIVPVAIAPVAKPRRPFDRADAASGEEPARQWYRIVAAVVAVVVVAGIVLAVSWNRRAAIAPPATPHEIAADPVKTSDPPKSDQPVRDQAGPAAVAPPQPPPSTSKAEPVQTASATKPSQPANVSPPAAGKRGASVPAPAMFTKVRPLAGAPGLLKAAFIVRDAPFLVRAYWRTLSTNRLDNFQPVSTLDFKDEIRAVASRPDGRLLVLTMEGIFDVGVDASTGQIALGEKKADPRSTLIIKLLAGTRAPSGPELTLYTDFSSLTAVVDGVVRSTRNDGLSSIAANGAGDRVAVGYCGGFREGIGVLTVATLKEENRFGVRLTDRPGNCAQAVAFYDNDRRIVAVGRHSDRDGTLLSSYAVDTGEGRDLDLSDARFVEKDEEMALAIAARRPLAAIAVPGEVVIVDLDAMTIAARIKQDQVVALSFSSDGSTLAIATPREVRIATSR
jgi:hypothetical protein